MIEFKHVKLQNFKSFGNKETVIKLDDSGSTLILGNNEDIGEKGNSRNAVGKCLGYDTPVMMHDGSIKMVQDIVVGDKLMGDDGTPRNVLTLARGQEQMYRVSQKLGMDYVVNESHILSLKVGTTRPKWGHFKGDIINLPVSEYMKYPKFVKSGVCGYIGDLTELDNGKDVFEPWLIGLWLADGTRKAPSITYNVDDVELYYNVRKIARTYGWNPNIISDRETCFTEYYSNGFVGKLRQIGVFKDKHIPQDYLFSSYQNRLELLAGIIDGDGYNNRGRSIDIALKQGRLPQDLIFLARSVGLRVKVSEKFSKCQNFEGGMYTRLSISGDITKIPNRLSRKHGSGIPETAKPRHYGVTGITVEPIGWGDYYGFEIDGNRLFCLGDMTVTHNTSALSAVVFALYGKDLDRLKPDELVNLRNGKKMRVELSFSVKGVDFTVIRGRKPNILELYQGDKSLTRDSMKNTEQEILDIVGIDYDVFLSIFFLNPFKETFMAMTPASQRNFMEKVLSLDVLAERAEALKAIKKDLTVDVKLAIKDRDNAVLMREREEQQLQKLEERAKDFEVKRQEAIEDCVLAKEEYAKLDFGSLIEEATEATKPNLNEEKIKELEKQQSQLNREKKTIIKQIEMVNKQIENSQKWETDRQSQINELEKRINELPSLGEIEERDEIRQQILVKENEILRLQDSMRKLAETDIPALNKEQESLEKEFTALEGGKCPYCKQKHTDESRMEEIADEFEQSTDRVDKLLEKLRELEEKVKAGLDEVDELKTNVPDVAENISISDVRTLEDRLAALQEQENPHNYEVMSGEEESRLVNEIEESVDEISKSIEKMIIENKEFDARQRKMRDDLDGKVGTWDIEEIHEMKRDFESIDKLIAEETKKENPYQTQLSEFGDLPDVDAYDDNVTKLEEEEKHCTYLVKLLTDPKSFIRKNIVDQYVPYLNKKINEYTQYLDLPHVSEINSDMTVDIEYMGKAVSYFTLSRGERMRVDIATAMAFRDLLKMMGTGTNLLLVDEVLDSALDSHGTHKAFNFIKKFASNTLLVSHREEFQTMVDRVMVISKRNGFSIID